MEKQQTKKDLRQQFHQQVIPKMVWGHELNQQDRDLRKRWIQAFNPDLNLLKHYTNKGILFEITKYQGRRELIFHEIHKEGTYPIRHLTSSKVENLLFAIYYYEVIENPKTVYTGLVDFKIGKPIAPFKIQEKIKWQKEFWTGGERKYLDYIQDYAFGLDIDGVNFNESYEDARRVFELFKKYKIKFSVWCSGKKGWHMIIPYQEFSKFFKNFDIDVAITSCKGLMTDLVAKLKLKDVDHRIYSPTRYLKTPYTIDSRNGNIIYPLTDSEFENFDKSMMTTEHLLKNKNLGFRGTFCGRQSNPEGFSQMVEFLDK